MAFWKHRPLQDPTSGVAGPLQDRTPPAGQPASLAAGLSWCTPTLTDLHTLLCAHYRSAGSAEARVPSAEALSWGLGGPGPSWRVGIDAGGSLIGAVVGYSATVRIDHTALPVACITGLCVAPEHRSQDLAPRLIDEVTRQVQHTGRWQALFQTERRLPGALCTLQRWQRPLNLPALSAAGYFGTGLSAAPVRLARRFPPPRPARLIPLTEDRLPEALALIEAAASQERLALVLSLEEAAHWLLPRPGVLSSALVCDVTGRPQAVVSLRWVTLLPAGLRAAVGWLIAGRGGAGGAISLAAAEGADLVELSGSAAASLPSKSRLIQGGTTSSLYAFNWACPPRIVQPSCLSIW